MLEIQILPIPNLPIIKEGDNIAELLLKTCENFELQDGDILVIAHTIVSRAEGRVVQLSEIVPSAFADPEWSCLQSSHPCRCCQAPGHARKEVLGTYLKYLVQYSP